MNPEHLRVVRDGPERIAQWRAEHPGETLDLSGADLQGTSLEPTNLANTDLSGADLRGASLKDANLTNADLSGACLHAANLCWADLTGASLRNADLTRADFTDAHLSGADLIGASLRAATLQGARLHDAKLPEQQMKAAAAKYGSRWTVGFDQLFLAALGAVLLWIWVSGERPYKFQLIWGVSLLILAGYWELDRRMEFRRGYKLGALLAGDHIRFLFVVIEKAGFIPRFLAHVVLFRVTAPAAVVFFAYDEANKRGWLRRWWAALTKTKLRSAATYLTILLIAGYVGVFIFKYPLIRPYTPRPLRWLSLTESRFLEYRARIEDGYQAFQTALDECAEPERCQTEAALDFRDIIHCNYKRRCLYPPEWMSDTHIGVSGNTWMLITSSLFRDIQHESDRDSAIEWSRDVLWSLARHFEALGSFSTSEDVDRRAESVVNSFFRGGETTEDEANRLLLSISLRHLKEGMDEWQEAAAK